MRAKILKIKKIMNLKKNNKKEEIQNE